MKQMIYCSDAKRELLYTDTYKGFVYYIMNLGTHPTAYIEIPKDHEFFGKGYNQIYDICDIDVHGGLTYSADHLLGVKEDSWFIGWDYAHAGDYCGYYKKFDEYGLSYDKYNEKKWTTEEIIEDCKRGINSILYL